MRVAALYDIHANLPALEAVLQDVGESGADLVVCGGDVISGPYPAETLDRLLGLPDVRFVRGNADRLVLERGDAHLGAWCHERLGAERLDRIASWPLTDGLDVPGLGRVLFCHATPRSDEELVTRATPEADVRAALTGVEAGVVVCGHVHVRYDRVLGDGRRVVNPGSVGMPYEGVRGAFWALLGPDVELRHTVYDVPAACDAVAATGCPACAELLGWLADPPDPEDVTRHFEAQRGA